MTLVGPPPISHPQVRSKKGFSTAPRPLEIDVVAKMSVAKFSIEFAQSLTDRQHTPKGTKVPLNVVELDNFQKFGK